MKTDENGCNNYVNIYYRLIYYTEDERIIFNLKLSSLKVLIELEN